MRPSRAGTLILKNAFRRFSSFRTAGAFPQKEVFSFLYIKESPERFPSFYV
jgi:hypothetical protein